MDRPPSPSCAPRAPTQPAPGGRPLRPGIGPWDSAREHRTARGLSCIRTRPPSGRVGRSPHACRGRHGLATRLATRTRSAPGFTLRRSAPRGSSWRLARPLLRRILGLVRLGVARCEHVHLRARGRGVWNPVTHLANVVVRRGVLGPRRTPAALRRGHATFSARQWCVGVCSAQSDGSAIA